MEQIQPLYQTKYLNINQPVFRAMEDFIKESMKVLTLSILLAKVQRKVLLVAPCQLHDQGKLKKCLLLLKLNFQFIS